MQGEWVQTKGLAFFITPNKLIVCTALQTFLIEEDSHYWRKRLNNMRVVALMGQIDTLDELSHWLSVYDQNGAYVGQCLKLIPYKRSWIV